MHGKAKMNIENEKKNKTQDAENHPNPDHNSGNATRATNEWADYPHQSRH